MRRRGFLALAGAPLMIIRRAGAAGLDFTAVNAMVVETIGLPAYAALADRAAALEEAVGAACRAPDEAGRARALAAFEATFDAWETAAAVRIGPAFEAERAARIQFWPDRHGTATRQLARALAAPDPGLLEPGGVARASVALQGLPALEVLLVDELRKPDGGNACRLAAAIAAALAALTREIAQAWPTFAAEVVAAGQQDGRYDSPFDPASEILKGVGDLLDIIIAHKLERPLGQRLEDAAPRRAERWRTGRSLAAIRANLRAAQQIITGERGFAELLVAVGGDPAVALRLREGFAAALATIEALGVPLEEAVGDPVARPQVERLLAQVKSLRALVTAELGPALGIGAGFNALDGDGG